MDQVAVFDQHRPLLFGLAYRMLGSAMEADDILQEAFLRWDKAETASVHSPRAYLATITTRLCLDQLRSARAKRETYLGPWLPEPLVTNTTPVEAAELADSLSVAFLALLEQLNPLERAVFLLREVFDYDYAEIAVIVEKNEDHCRQLLKRAKDHLAARRPRYSTSRQKQAQITFQFAQAVAGRDMEGLLTLLAEDITLWSDGGGQVTAARHPILGSDKVARFMLGIMGKLPSSFSVRFGETNGQAAIITYRDDGRPYSVLVLDIAGDHIRGVYNMMNPDKLQKVPRLIG